MASYDSLSSTSNDSDDEFILEILIRLLPRVFGNTSDPLTYSDDVRLQS